MISSQFSKSLEINCTHPHIWTSDNLWGSNSCTNNRSLTSRMMHCSCNTEIPDLINRAQLHELPKFSKQTTQNFTSTHEQLWNLIFQTQYLYIYWKTARLRKSELILKYQFILSKIKSFIKKISWNLFSTSHTSTHKNTLLKMNAKDIL